MTCKDCKHFVFWKDNDSIFGGHAEGVCTAVRPNLGPPPNREVKCRDGAECKAFEEAK